MEPFKARKIVSIEEIYSSEGERPRTIQKFAQEWVETLKKENPEFIFDTVSWEKDPVRDELKMSVTGTRPGVNEKLIEAAEQIKDRGKVLSLFPSEWSGFVRPTESKQNLEGEGEWVDSPELGEEGAEYFARLMKEFVGRTLDDFYRAHPNAVITNAEPVTNEDGSITINIEGVEPGQSIIKTDASEVCPNSVQGRLD